MSQLAINFVHIESIDAYLPEALIISGGKRTPSRWLSRATASNIDSYSVDLPSASRAAIVRLCDSLHISTIEAKHNRNKGRKVSITELYDDKPIKKLIRQYLARHLAKLFNLIEEHSLVLLIDAHRTSLLADHVVTMSPEALQPILHFEKTQTGIKYRLLVRSSGDVLALDQSDIKILCDEPAYLIINKQRHSLSHINANKVRPFLSKPYLFVPDRLVPQLFEKFVLPVAQKAEIQADGFEYIQHEEVLSVTLITVHDFISRRWLIDLVFDYGRSSVPMSSRVQRKTSVDLLDDHLVLHQVVRSPSEDRYSTAMTELGLAADSDRHQLYLADSNEYDLYLWVIQHRGQLADLGIRVPMLSLHGETLAEESPQLTTTKQVEGDWFDIYGTVTVGDLQIPFADLLPYIRAGDRLCPLPDGTHFIIPAAWMATYGGVSKVAQRSGDTIRLRRSQAALLDEPPIDATGLVVDHTSSFKSHPHLKATLRPYQQAGAAWLVNHYHTGLGACLADDMGLGKTIQTLAVLNYAKDKVDRATTFETDDAGQLSLFAQSRVEELSPLRALVVLPSSLVFNWNQEIRKFSPRLIATQYIGSKRSEKVDQLDKFDIVLTTYQTAVRDIDVLREISWEYVILDESHTIKNRKSKTFEALCQLESQHRLSLTGTPIENSLQDLWSQMHFLNPGLLGSYRDFDRLYYQPIHRDGDEESLTHLRQLVSPYILRRRKQEVAADLPAIEEQIITVDMASDQAQVYQEEKSAARNAILQINDTEGGSHLHVLTALMRLRQICNHPILAQPAYDGPSGKLLVIADQLQSIHKAGHKVLVFSSFTQYLDLVGDELTQASIPYVSLTGRSSQSERRRAVDVFQNDSKVTTFLISIKAGGTGLNLTAASYVMILDPWWNPFVEEQAKARAHRIGQTQPVTVLKYIARDSIEEKILRLQARKKVVAAELIEDETRITFTRAELEDLLA